MKPFLLLATRAEDDVADEEYETVLRFSGLRESMLHRVRLEAGPMPPIDLGRYSGVIIGGSPFNSSDPPEAARARPPRRTSAGVDSVGA